jgi:hypothetical protein
LGIVTLFLVPVTTGIATIAVQGAKALLSQDIEQLRSRVIEIQSMSDRAAMSTSENLGKAEGAAEAAVARSNEAENQLTHLKQAVATADNAKIAVQDARKIIASLAKDPEFSRAVWAAGSVQLESFSGPRVDAARVSQADVNWGATGPCPADSTLINFYCQIDSGGGNLQNLGVHERRFGCLWNSVSGNFHAWGQPLCLRIKKN